METTDDAGEQPLGWAGWMSEKVQNGTIAVLDEIKFWGEVFVDYWNQDDADAMELLKEYEEAMQTEKLAKHGHTHEQDVAT
ncbi:unnamed protein product [Moneuplotes crassus]|uniref:Uncharacterized protein n=1 Tax=Euplotes crassus TaxID=5936 RepID=A0AAD2D912_EUPCR|nr:unnamed protein product [Moneuplotes crassus]